MSAPREAAWKPRSEMKVLNTDIQRLDGPDKATGRAVYTHDVRLPNMVYARLVLHHAPRAVLQSLDVSPAKEVPGVVAAGVLHDEGDVLAYLGDDSALAWVAAETPEAAREGAWAVRRVLTDLQPTMTTPEQTLQPGAPELSSRGNASSGRERGDRDKVFAAIDEAPHQLEAEYELPIQHHVCLETHGHVVDYDGERATVYASTQAVSSMAGDFADLLDLPADRVRVLTPVMGGGFGSKFGPGLEGATAARIAKQLVRPVHLMLDRPQEFQMAGNRSGSKAKARAGCNAEGRIVGLHLEVDRYGGMGVGSFPTPPYIYKPEATSSLLRTVHTALDSNRAMRAPGHPQSSFVTESIVDELAAKAGLDSIEFRKLNLEDDVWHTQLDTVAEKIGWGAHPNRKGPGVPDADGYAEGIGFGVATWRAGGVPGCEVEVRISPDGSVTSSTAVQDLGTGARTYVAAIVAEELGLGIADVTPRIGDSDLPPSVGSGGSITTGSLAPSVKSAAFEARRALEDRLSEQLGQEPDAFVFADGKVTAPGIELTFREACAMLGTQPATGRGKFTPHLVASQGRLHGAQAARVRVDTLTGRVELLHMVGMHDQGIPMNRLALTSQINGGMIGALSYGLLEERVMDPELGLLLTGSLENYKIAGTKEMPRMDVILDDDDPRHAVTGMAEAPAIPGHAAIANAIFNACGARLRSLPFTPDRVLAALAEKA